MLRQHTSSLCVWWWHWCIDQYQPWRVPRTETSKRWAIQGFTLSAGALVGTLLGLALPSTANGHVAWWSCASRWRADDYRHAWCRYRKYAKNGIYSNSALRCWLPGSLERGGVNGGLLLALHLKATGAADGISASSLLLDCICYCSRPG